MGFGGQIHVGSQNKDTTADTTQTWEHAGPSYPQETGSSLLFEGV